MTNDKRVKNFRLGFTLIEMLIVIAIISTIAGVSVSNFRAAEKQKRAAIAVDSVVNSIRNAQNFTLTGKSTNNANAACRVPQYYFVTFSYSNSYTLSAFNNCNTTDQIETYTLPVNTQIKASGLSLGVLIGNTNLVMAFYPPFGTMKAALDNAVYSTFTTAQIIVQTIDGSASKTVQVDGVSGRIGE